jgi:hypothetical protein
MNAILAFSLCKLLNFMQRKKGGTKVPPKLYAQMDNPTLSK